MRSVHAIPLAQACLLLLAGMLPAAQAPGAAPAPPSTAQPVLERARAAWARGEHAAALALLQPAGLAGYREAQFTLGLLLESLPGAGQAQFAEAAIWYLRAAQAGHAGAMNNLAVLHQEGRGVPVTLPVSRLWYERAAAAGLVQAQHNLALLHARGIGVPRDRGRMLYWLERAAAGGHLTAQVELGIAYLGGGDTPGNPIRARQLLEKAAARDDAEAQYRLGRLLLEAEPAAALAWLRKAGDQAHALGAWEAARILENRQGPEDAGAALEYYRASASVGHRPSMERMLRIQSEGGLGQPPNPGLARFWTLRLQAAPAAQDRTTAMQRITP